MRGTGSVETYASLAALPPEALTLLDEAPGFFAGRAWWDAVLSHAMPAGGAAVFVVVRSAGRVAAVVPMLRTGRRLGSLTTPYTCEYVPLLAAGLDAVSRIAAMAAFGRSCRSAGVVRLDALPAEWDGLAGFERGIRRAGLLPLRFNHFGNWREEVAAKDWSAYLAGRTGALRETIRRRLRRADRLADARFDLLTRPDGNGPGGGGIRSGLWAELEGTGTLSDVQRGIHAGDGGVRVAALRPVVDRFGTGRGAGLGGEGPAGAGAEAGA